MLPPTIATDWQESDKYIRVTRAIESGNVPSLARLHHRRACNVNPLQNPTGWK